MILSIFLVNPSDSSSFLTTSQTFFGVITTIVVLCLFMDPSNFIYKILLDFKSLIKRYSIKKIKIICVDIERKIGILKPLVILYSNSVKEKDLSLYEEGVVLLDNLGLMNLKINGQINAFNQSINKLFNFCSKAEEQIMAPLYTFLFCIVIFCYDEIYSITKGEIVTNAIFFFTILSYIFWIEIWRCYFKRTSPDNILLIKKTIKHNNYNFLRILGRFSINIFFFIFIAYIFYVLGLFIIKNYILYCVFLLSIAVSFYMFFYLCHANIFLKRKNNYSKIFIFSHFVCVLLLSLFNTIILVMFSCVENGFIYLDFFTGTYCLKYLVISFALLNGLIIPFVAPLLRYVLYKKYIKDKIYEIKYDSINSSYEEVIEYRKKVEAFFK